MRTIQQIRDDLQTAEALVRELRQELALAEYKDSRPKAEGPSATVYEPGVPLTRVQEYARMFPTVGANWEEGTSVPLPGVTSLPDGGRGSLHVKVRLPPEPAAEEAVKVERRPNGVQILRI